MSISYPTSAPSGVAPRSVKITPRSVVAVEESPFSLVQQAYAWSGAQQWILEVEYPPMIKAGTHGDAAALVAWLTGLNGREGTFLFGDPANKTPAGVATGTPLVNGASQTGYDLITDGWTTGVTGILKAGDWIQLGTGASSRLHMVMATVNSDGSGNATLTLWPKLRSSPSDNAAIVTSSPRGVFRLISAPQWSIDRAKVYGVSFKAQEVI